MHTGQRPRQVFDQLHARGLIDIPTEGRTSRRPHQGRWKGHHRHREQVTALNSAVRGQRLATGENSPARVVTTTAGERLGVGDLIAMRRDDRDLSVANRDQRAIAGTDDCAGPLVRGRGGSRTLPAGYVREHDELAYASTVHGAQGKTVDHAHLLIGEATGAAATYVGMTRKVTDLFAGPAARPSRNLFCEAFPDTSSARRSLVGEAAP